MSIFRGSFAVRAEGVSHNINLIAICKEGGGDFNWGGGGAGWCLHRDPQPHLEGEGERRKRWTRYGPMW